MICASSSVRLRSSRNTPCHEDSTASSSDFAFRPLGRIHRVVGVANRSPSASNLSSGANARALMTRSEEHTTELQSRMRTSSAVSFLQQKKNDISQPRPLQTTIHNEKSDLPTHELT